MKYFLDTEFIEDGKTIDLISVGIVAEDEREFYAVSTEAQLHRASDWVRKNVLPHLPAYDHKAWMSRDEIRAKLVSFVGDDKQPEFWAYYADYDWVVLCQLFGIMMNLPEHFPKYCLDLKQLAHTKGVTKLPPMTRAEHHALADAQWNRRIYSLLTEPAGQPKSIAEDK